MEWFVLGTICLNIHPHIVINLLSMPYYVLEACLRVNDETLTKIINWFPIYAKNPQKNIKRFFLPLSDSYSRSKIGIGLLAKVKTFVNCGCIWIMRVLFHIDVLFKSWFVGQSQDHFLSIDIDYETFHVNGSHLTRIIKLVVPKPKLSWFRGKRLGKYIRYIGICIVYIFRTWMFTYRI